MEQQRFSPTPVCTDTTSRWRRSTCRKKLHPSQARRVGHVRPRPADWPNLLPDTGKWTRRDQGVRHGLRRIHRLASDGVYSYADGHDVVGVDGLTDTYSREVKLGNLERARRSTPFRFHAVDLGTEQQLDPLVRR